MRSSRKASDRHSCLLLSEQRLQQRLIGITPFFTKAASHRPAFPHQNTFYQSFWRIPTLFITAIVVESYSDAFGAKHSARLQSLLGYQTPASLLLQRQ
jgi:hypothetical protein